MLEPSMFLLALSRAVCRLQTTPILVSLCFWHTLLAVVPLLVGCNVVLDCSQKQSNLFDCLKNILASFVAIIKNNVCTLNCNHKLAKLPDTCCTLN